MATADDIIILEFEGRDSSKKSAFALIDELEKRLNELANDAKKALAGLGKSVDKSSIDKATEAVDKLAKKLDEIGKKGSRRLPTVDTSNVDTYAETVKKLNKALAEAGAKPLTSGASQQELVGIAEALSKAEKEARKFEQSIAISDVAQKNLSTTSEQIDRLKQSLAQLASQEVIDNESERKIISLQSSIKKLEGDLNKLGNAFKSQSTETYAQDIARLTTEIEKLRTSDLSTKESQQELVRLSEELKKAEANLGKFSSALQGKPAETYADKVERLRSEMVRLRSTQLDTRESQESLVKLARELDNAERQLHEFERASNQGGLKQSLKNSFSDFFDLQTLASTAAGTLIGTGLFDVAQKVFDAVHVLGSSAKEAITYYQALDRSLTSLVARELSVTGAFANVALAQEEASEQAQELRKWTQRLAEESPFEEEDIANALRLTAAYGFTIKEAQRLTTATVNLASATGLGAETVERIALALGQIKSKGRVQAEELNQLTEAGFNATGVLAEMGLTLDDVRRGLVDANSFIPAVVNTINRDFAGAAKAATNDLDGLLSTISDLKKQSLETAFRPASEEVFQPFFASLAESMKASKDELEAFGQELAKNLSEVDWEEFSATMTQFAKDALVLADALSTATPYVASFFGDLANLAREGLGVPEITKGLQVITDATEYIENWPTGVSLVKDYLSEFGYTMSQSSELVEAFTMQLGSASGGFADYDAKGQAAYAASVLLGAGFEGTAEDLARLSLELSQSSLFYEDYAGEVSKMLPIYNASVAATERHRESLARQRDELKTNYQQIASLPTPYANVTAQMTKMLAPANALILSFAKQSGAIDEASESMVEFLTKQGAGAEQILEYLESLGIATKETRELAGQYALTQEELSKLSPESDGYVESVVRLEGQLEEVSEKMKSAIEDIVETRRQSEYLADETRIVADAQRDAVIASLQQADALTTAQQAAIDKALADGASSEQILQLIVSLGLADSALLENARNVALLQFQIGGLDDGSANYTSQLALLTQDLDVNTAALYRNAVAAQSARSAVSSRFAGSSMPQFLLEKELKDEASRQESLPVGADRVVRPSRVSVGGGGSSVDNPLDELKKAEEEISDIIQDSIEKESDARKDNARELRDLEIEYARDVQDSKDQYSADLVESEKEYQKDLSEASAGYAKEQSELKKELAVELAELEDELAKEKTTVGLEAEDEITDARVQAEEEINDIRLEGIKAVTEAENELAQARVEAEDEYNRKRGESFTNYLDKVREEKFNFSDEIKALNEELLASEIAQGDITIEDAIARAEALGIDANAVQQAATLERMAMAIDAISRANLSAEESAAALEAAQQAAISGQSIDEAIADYGVKIETASEYAIRATQEQAEQVEEIRQEYADREAERQQDLADTIVEIQLERDNKITELESEYRDAKLEAEKSLASELLDLQQEYNLRIEEIANEKRLRDEEALLEKLEREQELLTERSRKEEDLARSLSDKIVDIKEDERRRIEEIWQDLSSSAKELSSVMQSSFNATARAVDEATSAVGRLIDALSKVPKNTTTTVTTEQQSNSGTRPPVAYRGAEVKGGQTWTTAELRDELFVGHETGQIIKLPHKQGRVLPFVAPEDGVIIPKVPDSPSEFNNAVAGRDSSESPSTVTYPAGTKPANEKPRALQSPTIQSRFDTVLNGSSIDVAQLINVKNKYGLGLTSDEARSLISAYRSVSAQIDARYTAPSSVSNVNNNATTTQNFFLDGKQAEDVVRTQIRRSEQGRVNSLMRRV